MKRKIIFILIFSFLLTTIFCQQNRFALVIGNSDYKGVPLRNPVNDANDIAATLRELDFEVIKRTNLNKRELEESAETFENMITSSDVALFYYSGHGLQVDGINYLIPLNANIDEANDVRYEAVELNRIITKLEKARLNIIILDACRDNPFKGFRSTSRGLAQISTDKVGTFIAYSTGPGKVAIDGTGRNSPYTKNLIAKMKTDMKIEDAFKEVAKSVFSETNGKQKPWLSSSLLDDFYFCMSCAPKTTEPETRVGLDSQLDSGFDNLVFVKGGTFMMGSNDGDDDEKPVHEVYVSDFYIGTYEVTVAEFKEFIDATSYKTDAEKSGYSSIWDCGIEEINGVTWKCDVKGNKRPLANYNHPVIHISWDDANAYCKCKGGRLPTNSEWEYAARGGNKRRSVSLNGVEDYKYSGSNNFDEVGWYDENSGGRTHPVGRKKPNELGIYDMNGNASEWCYHPKDSYYIMHGNSWLDAGKYCNVTSESGNYPTYSSHSGFRLVRSVE
ncbi:MAG: SUMF1/EgtB/PvdO family nonheme iron enzyme [Candidatus Cloacimonetes bacterium]|nr:SUMF1/EgtB/PvdO family nonheme iron enzyme [Candidatus Cloacimonadota bacterium]